MYTLYLSLLLSFSPSHILTIPVAETAPYVLDETSTSSLKAYVEKEFADIPEMSAIVECESGYRQFDTDGNPLMSHTQDVGIAQINNVHFAWAKERGLDIFHSAKDNLTMARLIYEAQGLDAWVCYKK